MKTLYLLRHAHATAEAPPLMGDHERILSEQGAMEAEKVAAFMKDSGILPDFVLSSSSVRTIQTARIIMGVILDTEGRRIDTRFDRGLYLAEPAVIAEDIAATDNRYGHLLVVGHNPGMGDLAMRLSDGAITSFPTASLAAFTADIDDWQALTPEYLKLTASFTP